MKNTLYVLFYFLFFASASVYAQIEKVIVETYYVSDANDETDTTGGVLEEGSKTYRIYIDLMPGSKLRKIYGDANHALKISSTASFFNNKVDGQTFGKDFSKTRLRENTVALDSWITLGQATRVAAKTYFGIPKTDDHDGSIIGGVNNDGGSTSVAGGLLLNADNAAGIPLTTADGLDTMTMVPASWADYGFVDFATGTDSTIFGSIMRDQQFVSYNAGLQNSGVAGVNPDSNQVLVAQLTTKGDISFELNLEVEEPDGATTKIVKYVANNDTLLPDERICAFLKYPAACGCQDPNYVEYNPAYSCNNSDSCRTLIKFGCMDSIACNYDPDANFNIPAMCCYPGYCNDRDIGVVCPQLAIGRFKSYEFGLYPNPAQSLLSIKGKTDESVMVTYSIFDSYGRMISGEDIGLISGSVNKKLDISGFAKGVYLVRVSFGEVNTGEVFIKE